MNDINLNNMYVGSDAPLIKKKITGAKRSLLITTRIVVLGAIFVALRARASTNSSTTAELGFSGVPTGSWVLNDTNGNPMISFSHNVFTVYGSTNIMNGPRTVPIVYGLLPGSNVVGVLSGEATLQFFPTNALGLSGLGDPVHANQTSVRIPLRVGRLSQTPAAGQGTESPRPFVTNAATAALSYLPDGFSTNVQINAGMPANTAGKLALQMTLTSNTMFLNPTNGVDNQNGVLELIQDAAGNRNPFWGTSWTVCRELGGTTAALGINLAPNKHTWVGFWYSSSLNKYIINSLFSEP